MILLIKPEPVANAFSLDMALKTEPLELEYLSALLKGHNYDTYLYDASMDKTPFSDLLFQLKPDVVAVTGYITQEYLMKSYIRKSKTYNPNTVTIIGGSHAQLNYSHFYITELDFICRSDNIFVFLEIIDSVYHKSDAAFLSMDGLCYQKDGIWNENDLRPFHPNRLPFPDRSHFMKHKNSYRYLDVSPVALLKTSSSCPFKCSFCYGTKLNCGKHLQRDVSLIIEEIQTIDCENIQIIDDDFLFNTTRLRLFIDLIKKYSINKTFICYGRADFIVQETQLMKGLVEIGFRYFMVGLEATNNHALAAYDKKTSVNMNEACVKVIHLLKANIVGLFIIDIHFKKEDFRNMRTWIKKQKIVYTGVSIFTPIPGTKLYEEYKDQLITQDMEKWDFMHLVVSPINMSKFAFYFEYYLLVLDLLRIAGKAGIYSFLKLGDYKSIFWNLLWTEGLNRKK